MRLSTNNTRRCPWPLGAIAIWADVTLNGEHIAGATMADEEMGVVKVYRTEPHPSWHGEITVVRRNGRRCIEHRHGVVRIGLRENAPQTVRAAYEAWRARGRKP